MVIEDIVALLDCSDVGDDVKLAALVVVLSAGEKYGKLLESPSLADEVIAEELMSKILAFEVDVTLPDFPDAGDEVTMSKPVLSGCE